MVQQINESGTEVDQRGSLPWNPSVEKLLAGWCDQSKAFEWMHSESSSYFDRKARRLMVTINILVATSGLTNIITGNIIIYGFQINWIFGALTVFTSIANMLQDKLAWQHSADMHKRQASLQGAIRRKLEEELSLPATSRRDCKTFMRYIRSDINMTTQTSVRIPAEIRKECYNRFKNVANFDLPDICGHVEHTRIYEEPSTPEKDLEEVYQMEKERMREELLNELKPDNHSIVNTESTLEHSDSPPINTRNTVRVYNKRRRYYRQRHSERRHSLPRSLRRMSSTDTIVDMTVNPLYKPPASNRQLVVYDLSGSNLPPRE